MVTVLRQEFAGYSAAAFQGDLLAGLTVAAVALPLALAFGVASGATAAAGMVTAILAGVLIGGLGGAGFQVSGPTGAMSAVLIVLASRYGLEGVWVAGVIAGIIVLLMGLFDLGQLVNFIPSSVLAGFTSGIAVIIFAGQIDNLLGVHTAAAENTVTKLLGYFRFDYQPNFAALGISLLVIAIMVFWPKKLNAHFPGSLLALTVATLVTVLAGLDVPSIGEIPRTILLADRLELRHIPWDHLGDLVAPALSIAALGAIESLMCGSVGGRMAGQKLASNQELIAQGLGNIVIPFFGGVPATAAIARTSVAIKSGARTRLTSVVHAVALLLVVLLAAPVLQLVPLAGLAGVLAVTAFRMNDWPEIRTIFQRGFKSAIIVFVVTLIATIALDLTQAIIVGVGLSAVGFVLMISRASVSVSPALPDKLREAGYEMQTNPDHYRIVYMVGPLFFGSTTTFNAALEGTEGKDVIFSLRTVPLIDVTGLAALEEAIHRVEAAGGHVFLSGLNPPVESYLRRCGLLDKLGPARVHWSAFEAIVAADQHRAPDAPSGV
ncbi:MAG: SulP family inorganic anion transporter [Anaerolineae bacterium]|nr:SulP family inorganic anion transporter [Anaerolineae bacterium]